jgi:transcriptional regulator with XRE-family HTH domain
MIATMPPKPRIKLPPLDLGDESLGHRLARIRKERGFTQVELAERIGTIQVIVSDYERDRVRMHAEMLARFAQALGVTADALLGLKSKANGKSGGRKISRRVLRRLELIERLAPQDQRALLRTIDAFLKGAQTALS